MAEVFGGPGFGAATADGLVNRLVMLNGLPDDKKQTAFSKIKLGETVPVTLANGRSATISLLHNGYILGGGRTGLDCSSLVSSALPPDVRRGRFTTLDFRAMWIYRRTGYFMAPPQYHKERETLVREVANAFVPLDVYAGDRLIAGDLLVYRLPWESTGHVFVVRDFDGATTRATVIEAAQSAGTIREREFNLSPDSPRAHRRLLRPGLLALRLKPVTTSVCTYRTDRAGRTSLNNGGMPR